MTPGEFKFALRVETVLNTIPQPEYKQLMVEALIVLTMVAENDWTVKMDVIHVDRLVHEANALFIKDQVHCITYFFFITTQMVLFLSVVDHGFEPQTGQTKDYEIGICCFSTKHTALRRNG